MHPTKRQIFAGKPDSTFYDIWDLLISTINDVYHTWQTSIISDGYYWNMMGNHQLVSNSNSGPFTLLSGPSLASKSLNLIIIWVWESEIICSNQTFWGTYGFITNQEFFIIKFKVIPCTFTITTCQSSIFIVLNVTLSISWILFLCTKWSRGIYLKFLNDERSENLVQVLNLQDIFVDY